MTKKPQFVLQLHLTYDCEFNCKHCYFRKYEKGCELNISEIYAILHELFLFKQYFNNISINLTGGDPLLRDDIKKIIYECKNYNYSINILGNPLTSKTEPIFEEVSSMISKYQLSFDGHSNGHKYLRNIDNEKEVWRSVKKINELCVESCIMFTLTKRNKYELINALNIAASNCVREFDFSRLVPMNHIMIKEIVSPLDYKKLLNDLYSALTENNIHMMNYKDNLWKLFFYEQKIFNPKEKDKLGCSIGETAIAIMPDGSIYPCSRLPIKLGNIREVSLLKLFFENSLLNSFRDVNSYLKCSNCSLGNVCRGCPAITYATTGNCFKTDPQCWKKV